VGLITRAKTKTLWGIADADTSQDALIDLLIEQCSARCVTFCGHVLEAQSLTEYYQGTGNVYLVLRNWPVNSVTSVYEDMDGASGQGTDPFPAETLLTAGTDYELLKTGSGGVARSGILRRIGGVWQRPAVYTPGTISPGVGETGGTIKVTYNAGFATIPADLELACLLLMAATKRILGVGERLASEGWEDYNYAVQQAAGEAFGGLPADTLAVLSRLRSVAVG